MAARHITEGAVIDEFLAAMREKEIHVDEPIVADGKLHRYHVAGDRGRKRNAWAILHIDEHPAGKFGDHKRWADEEFPWSMEGGRALTPAERAAMQEKANLRAEQRQIEDAARHDEAARAALVIYNAAAHVTSHPYLTLKGVPPCPKLRIGKWYRYDEETDAQVVIADDVLIVPMMTSSTRILSLQGIIADDREPSGYRKQFMKGGQTQGTFCGIGNPRDDTILICEGLATGLSLWQCTEHGVLVAFSAGNLDAVTRIARRTRPEAKILLCADNDAYTEKPIKNPGVHFARGAAVRSSALITHPVFVNCDTRPSDFNDLHQLEGEAIVREFVARALHAGREEALVTDLPPPDADAPPEPAHNAHFAILGYDHGVYYLFQHGQRQLMEYTKADLNDGGFIELADEHWWEDNFPGATGGIDRRGAMNFIIRTATERGIFTPDKLRGRGAWLDQGRRVFHHGDVLTVDGERVDVTRLPTEYVYELAGAHCKPADPPLTDNEGFDLLELAGRFRWTMPASAALLMGWITLAPLCGALKWRPHIWVTGNAGSGKSTVLNEIIHPLLTGMCLYGLGNSTEAGFRQTLKADALPVLIDETESNEEVDVQRMQKIIQLARQASTESQARTFKGTAGGQSMYWHIRSMFCFSSIQVGIKHQADTERISVLTLFPKLMDGTAGKQWDVLSEQIHALVTQQEDMAGRLFNRTLAMLPTILKNVEVFKSVATETFSSQRAGDQYGTLLAGTFALISTKLATHEDARWVINQYNWKEHMDSLDTDEGQKALQTLLGAQLRGPHGVDLSVYEVVSVAKGIYRRGVELDPEEAIAMLARFGMKIMENYLALSNSSNELLGLMKDTTFRADFRGILLRLPGADRNDNKPIRLNGVSAKVTRIDLNPIFEGDHSRLPPKEPPY
jgi:putative DNA primase/helicase